MLDHHRKRFEILGSAVDNLTVRRIIVQTSYFYCPRDAYTKTSVYESFQTGIGTVAIVFRGTNLTSPVTHHAMAVQQKDLGRLMKREDAGGNVCDIAVDRVKRL